MPASPDKSKAKMSSSAPGLHQPTLNRASVERTVHPLSPEDDIRAESTAPLSPPHPSPYRSTYSKGKPTNQDSTNVNSPRVSHTNTKADGTAGTHLHKAKERNVAKPELSKEYVHIGMTRQKRSVFLPALIGWLIAAIIYLLSYL